MQLSGDGKSMPYFLCQLLLLFQGYRFEIKLIIDLCRVAARVARHNMRVKMRNVLVCIETVILKDVQASCTEMLYKHFAEKSRFCIDRTNQLGTYVQNCGKVLIGDYQQRPCRTEFY